MHGIIYSVSKSAAAFFSYLKSTHAIMWLNYVPWYLVI